MMNHQLHGVLKSDSSSTDNCSTSTDKKTAPVQLSDMRAMKTTVAASRVCQQRLSSSSSHLHACRHHQVLILDCAPVSSCHFVVIWVKLSSASFDPVNACRHDVSHGPLAVCYVFEAATNKRPKRLQERKENAAATAVAKS
jgi:hypothetical protein